MITSFANERIKELRRLQDRKYRQETALYWIEGLRNVAAALDDPENHPLETLVVAPHLLTSSFGQALVEAQRQRGLPVLEVSDAVFERLSRKEGPVGLAAVARQQWTALDDVALRPGKPWVALDSVADPGNLGTILRTLDGAGGDGLILLDQSTDPYDPASVRASMGALHRQKLTRCTLDEFTRWQARTNAAVIGTSDKATADFHEYRYPAEMILLMGSERQGLQPQHLALCHGVVSIPMHGASDSLNLAVATGIVLYEIEYQWRARQDTRPIKREGE